VTGTKGTPLGLDVTTPNVARMYDYYLGGKDNFEPDRIAAEKVLALVPGLRRAAVENRRFLRRVVRFLAAEAGVTQFLDIGSGLPQGDSVHEVALREVPDARVVYVDRDPVVLAHANELLRGTPEGLVSYVYGGLRDPELILREAAKTLDFSRPAAALLFGILHFFSDADDPQALIGQLMAPLAAGSGLAMSHLASDLHSEEMSETFNRLSSRMAETVILRNHDEVAGLFGGLDLVDPGVVQATQWRPDPQTPAVPSQTWVGAARTTG